MKTALLCLAFVAFPFHHLANAECPIPPPPCEALAQAAIVGVVDVIEAADPWQIAGDNLTPIPQVVRLSVVEGFKGVSPQQREISGSISNNGDSIFLKAGKRYLLYAHQPNRFGTWHTSCSRTRLADLAGAELSQLRQCTLK